MKRALQVLKAGLVLLLAVSLVMVARTTWENQAADASHEEARALAFPEPARNVQPAAPSSAPDEEPGPQDDLLLLDLPALQEVNPDVVGWIEIPDTEISYPLLRCEDNGHYLTHLWDEKKSPSGSIYFDQNSDPTLGSSHTIIYGHNRRNDTMFGTLRLYADPDHLQAHPSVYVAVANGVYRYDIFSAHEANVKSIVYQLNIEEAGLLEDLTSYCKSSSVVDAPIEPPAGARILTLSTCTGRDRSRSTRWVVHGALTRIYHRPEA